MKKKARVIICLVCLFMCSLYASAYEQRVQMGIYDLSGIRQQIVSMSVDNFLVKDGEGSLGSIIEVPDSIEVPEAVFAEANDNEYFIIIDMKTDNEENLYPEIEPAEVIIRSLQSTAGVAPGLGKDYRLFFIENGETTLNDKTEKILSSNNKMMSFTAEKLGTYIIYYNPQIYSIKFYSDTLIYDDEGILQNPEALYNEITDLKYTDVVNFPEIPQREGYIFTGWKRMPRWFGGGIGINSFAEPQPHKVSSNIEYYASWCPEDEYEPIRIDIESDEIITKGKEDGQKIILKTNYGVFADYEEFPSEWRSLYEAETNEEVKSYIISDWKSKWNVVGNNDIMIETAERIDDKTVELTLSGNSSDTYSNSDIYIEFDYKLLMPEPYEEDGQIIDWEDTKIKMDEDGVRCKMYRSDNAITLAKQAKPSTGGGGGGSVVKYTVEFETNGGSEIKKQSIRRNMTASEPEAPVKDGYTFAGWYEDAEFATEYNFDTKITKGITLYAAWDENGASEEKNNTDNRIILTIGQKTAEVFGEIKTNDVAPKIVNNYTMLPIRFVAESLEAVVLWDEAAPEVVTVVKDDIKIVITMGDGYALVNNEKVKLDAPALIENNRTYMPLRFISEELGAAVEWLPETEQVVITVK